jgi:outer membrane protein assembly factor BamA
VDGGVGSGTSDRFRVSAEWGHRNLDTRALAGAVNGEYAVDGSGHFRKSGVGGTLTEPWLLGVRLLGQVGVFQLSQDDRANPDFIRHHSEYGYTLTLFRELSRLSRATLTHESRFIEQDYDTLPGGVVARPDTLRGSYRTNSLRLTLERDLRDNRIVPGRGNYQVLAVEFAGGPLRGTSGYRKLIFSSSWYQPLSNGWTFAARSLAGLMRPYGTPPNDFSPNEGVDEEVAKVPFETRFFIGGPNTLRGYSENSIPPSGGLATLLGNAEMRVPLAGPFGVEVFVDMGNVWDRAEYIQLEDFIPPWQTGRNHPDDIHWTYGIGARLELPFGPLRADLAWSEDPGFPHGRVFNKSVAFAYQFAIGAAF